MTVATILVAFYCNQETGEIIDDIDLRRRVERAKIKEEPYWIDCAWATLYTFRDGSALKISKGYATEVKV